MKKRDYRDYINDIFDSIQKGTGARLDLGQLPDGICKRCEVRIKGDTSYGTN